ncbi:MAG: ABC transporter permease [Pseudomonadota bacterium]
MTQQATYSAGPSAVPQADDTLPARRPSSLRRFLERPSNAIFAALALLIVAAAILAPWITPFGYAEIDLLARHQPPSWSHWMGTDQFGRDVLTRVLYGARISLLVGFSSIAIAMVLGTLVGTVAAYVGGIVDDVLMRLIDILMSVPGVVLALAIVAVLEPSLINVIIALSVIRVSQFARVTRGASMVVMKQDYVSAGRVIGMSGSRIISRHILPNIMGPIIVLATVRFGNAILAEATLSFLGVGIQPPEASWGVLIADGYESLFIAPWVSIFPGLALFVTMLAFNMLGDGLRDHFDPSSRTA